MRQTAKRDKHSEIVEQRARKSATYRKTVARTLHQIDLALLVREMREDASLTQAELARRVGTTQSVIARLEDAEYTRHSLTMLERIATACGVALKLHAEKKPNFEREVALVQSQAKRTTVGQRATCGESRNQNLTLRKNREEPATRKIKSASKTGPPVGGIERSRGGNVCNPMDVNSRPFSKRILGR